MQIYKTYFRQEKLLNMLFPKKLRQTQWILFKVEFIAFNKVYRKAMLSFKLY